MLDKASRIQGHSPARSIGDDFKSEEARKLEPAVSVRRAHHGDLDVLVAQPGDASRPFALDRCPAFEGGQSRRPPVGFARY
jgi:hypothetical protein